MVSQRRKPYRKGANLNNHFKLVPVTVNHTTVTTTEISAIIHRLFIYNSKEIRKKQDHCGLLKGIVR
ncbi:MAG: hypothetical protein ACJAVI_004372 [Candidatus Azotimanducaceae bacterium]|jgi:hypothetical protein